MTKTKTTEYTHYRLCFRADVIEPLRSQDRFRILTGVGIFEMSKQDFLTVFDNVVASTSYTREGLYHYPTVPKKAMRFLVGSDAGALHSPRSRKKYNLPAFLTDQCSEEKYLRWLHRKAVAHVRRDRARGNKMAECAEYRFAIHGAVQESAGKDAYTGHSLDWSLISAYDNQAAKGAGRKYKRRFANLPTVDHVGNGLGSPDFKICAWKVNDAKSDLSLHEFITLCHDIINHHEGNM